MKNPLVSVICLVYNHEHYLKEAVSSILAQSYANIEIIVVDDASTDSSPDRILQICRDNPGIEFLQLDKNLGNCGAFNRGLGRSSGEFIIDMAADDVLFPDRVAEQVALFQTLNDDFGVVYSDAEYIDANGGSLGGHFHGAHPRVQMEEVPSGWIYQQLVSSYFVPAPTMMIRRNVLEELGGYDEQLAYEDFDFWVRSSRKFRYQYQEKVLTKIRITPGSMSHRQQAGAEDQLQSTYLVCLKAQKLNESPDEDAALARRLRYQFKHALAAGCLTESDLFYSMLEQVSSPNYGLRLMRAFGPLVVRLGLHRRK